MPRLLLGDGSPPKEKVSTTTVFVVAKHNTATSIQVVNKTMIM
jgi:hypothetical protein